MARQPSVRGRQPSAAFNAIYSTQPTTGSTCARPTLTEFTRVVHRLEDESSPKNRAFTRDELQSFFDYCDQRVEQAQASGRKGTLAALRDSAMFKTQYAFGLRRREVVMLEVTD